MYLNLGMLRSQLLEVNPLSGGAEREAKWDSTLPTNTLYDHFSKTLDIISSNVAGKALLFMTGATGYFTDGAIQFEYGFDGANDSSNGSHIGVIRATGTNTWIGIRQDSDQIVLHESVTGVLSNGLLSVPEPPIGTLVRLIVIGNLVELWFDRILQGAVQTSVLGPGYTGLILETWGNTATAGKHYLYENFDSLPTNMLMYGGEPLTDMGVILTY